MDDLGALEPSYVNEVLSSWPFVKISGVINVRSLGGYSTVSNTKTRTGYIFRGAELSGITEQGKQELRSLGISKVFDLRSDVELEKYNAPLPSIDGVEIQHTPVFKREDYGPEAIAKRFQLYASGKTEAFMTLYSQILDNAGPSFGAIMRHIRDKPSEGVLFHCTAGKDRTGVLAAIILKLVGCRDEDIADDYALTRVGREPARALIMARLSQEAMFASNNEAALNMFTCRRETMLAFLALLQERSGGPEGYLKTILGLTDEDLVIIKHNLLFSPESRL
ncbi:protein-tyrosine phosphatase-like protein [Mycena floridula]|nr:protein-tyrosine phosphatase-like protein [Mycena floridula]